MLSRHGLAWQLAMQHPAMRPWINKPAGSPAAEGLLTSCTIGAGPDWLGWQLRRQADLWRAGAGPGQGRRSGQAAPRRGKRRRLGRSIAARLARPVGVKGQHLHRQVQLVHKAVPVPHLRQSVASPRTAE